MNPLYGLAFMYYTVSTVTPSTDRQNESPAWSLGIDATEKILERRAHVAKSDFKRSPRPFTRISIVGEGCHPVKWSVYIASGREGRCLVLNAIADLVRHQNTAVQHFKTWTPCSVSQAILTTRSERSSLMVLFDARILNGDVG